MCKKNNLRYKVICIEIKKNMRNCVFTKKSLKQCK